MREILFRGKERNDGKWYFGNLSVISEKCATIAQLEKVHERDLDEFRNNRDDKYFYTYFVDPVTVGQFTGLYDKHGAKIFEGDLVKQRNGLIGEVYFSICTYGFKAIIINDPNGTYYNTLNNKFEIIGNIHDNPELLEVRHGN